MSWSTSDGGIQVRRGVALPGAGDRHDWGSLSLFADAELMNLETMTLGRVQILAGRSNPLHTHPNCTEVLILLVGRIEHIVGNDAVVLEPGDVLAVPAGVSHRAAVLGDVDADMIVAYTSGRREYQAIL
ncbi:MAG TPA: cupin domain-containing protein [Acidimicrobiia bacterium]|nr:cupin domain-containing protein [Acidimicrobiia bacterium]